jgi:DNA-directed RNA polymerase specialized sigma subunit
MRCAAMRGRAAFVRVRRELESAREELRRELGGEPTLADLARRVGTDEARLERTSRAHQHTSNRHRRSPNVDTMDSASLPAVLVPAEPPSPDRL